jgi:hypothetical protein
MKEVALSKRAKNMMEFKKYMQQNERHLEIISLIDQRVSIIIDGNVFRGRELRLSDRPYCQGLGPQWRLQKRHLLKKGGLLHQPKK